MATIIKTYGPLVLTNDHEATDNAVAKGIHSFMSQPKFLLTAALIADVLNIIDSLNRQFQTFIASFAYIKPLVSTAIKVNSFT